jgi:hypothetical protein
VHSVECSVSCYLHLSCFCETPCLLRYLCTLRYLVQYIHFHDQRSPNRIAQSEFWPTESRVESTAAEDAMVPHGSLSPRAVQPHGYIQVAWRRCLCNRMDTSTRPTPGAAAL